MILWRISNHRTLDGGGGLRSAGRWHSRGRRIVYCSPNPATALLEIMVHLEVEVEDIPVSFRYLQIEVPESAEMAEMRFPDEKWKTQVEVTRRIGDEWLNTGRSALLIVPCIIVPATTNVLMNPEHPASDGIRIVRIYDQPIDSRLLRS